MWYGMRVGSLVLGALALTAAAGMNVAFAQDRARDLVPQGWHVGRVRIEGHRSAPRAKLPVGVVSGHRPLGAHERNLTVTRRFAPPPRLEDSYLFESGTSYDNISAFDPAPTIDSGVQFPYGLDGVGGFGSDLGFGAGHDALVYDRGM